MKELLKLKDRLEDLRASVLIPEDGHGEIVKAYNQGVDAMMHKVRYAIHQIQHRETEETERMIMKGGKVDG